MTPWDAPFQTVSNFGEIFYLIFIWMLMTNGFVHFVASCVCVLSFRQAPHKWLIVVLYVVWSCLVTLFVGGTIGLLAAGFLSSGDYGIQRVIAMSIGVALTVIYSIISMFRWLATMG